jgi:hypothetical protein
MLTLDVADGNEAKLNCVAVPICIELKSIGTDISAADDGWN